MSYPPTQNEILEKAKKEGRIIKSVTLEYNEKKFLKCVGESVWSKTFGDGKIISIDAVRIYNPKEKREIKSSGIKVQFQSDNCIADYLFDGRLTYEGEIDLFLLTDFDDNKDFIL